MLGSYETVFILRPDLTEGGLKKIHDKLAEIIRLRGGTLAPVKDLGKKQMAYRIQKQIRGHYLQMNFQGVGELVGEVERQLRLTEEVLRFITVKEKKLRGASRAAAKKEKKQ